jgi:phosphoglycolate phosphatase
MNIFFDLDGTLIDFKIRTFKLFQELVPQSNFTLIDYWELKKRRISIKTILTDNFNFTENQIELFEIKWMNLIEDDRFLKFDQPFPGVTRYLNYLRKSGLSLFIITGRQIRNKVIDQIDTFGWANLFNQVLVTEQKATKTDLLVPYLSDQQSDWIVGDSDIDILTGKLLGLKTAAVFSGAFSREALLTFSPDLIVDNVINFSPFLINKRVFAQDKTYKR